MSTSTEPSVSTPPSNEDTHSDQNAVCTESLDSMLHREHPELVVLDLLRHTVEAAHQALGLIHPEIHARGNIGALPDEECHYALLLAAVLEDLPRLLSKYRAAVEYVMREEGELDDFDEPDDIEIPF